MNIDLDREVVTTRHDTLTNDCFYTIQRAGNRWTAKVPLAELEQHGENKGARRDHVISAIEIAMRGEPDKAPDPPDFEGSVIDDLNK
jgi:hypothetical protein